MRLILCIYFKSNSLYFTNFTSMTESRKCRRKGWSRHMMVRWTKNSLTRRDSVAGSTVTSPSPLPLLIPLPSPSCPSSVLSVEKRGLDRSPSTRSPRKSPSSEMTRWLCPLLRASGPLEPFVGLSQETPGRRSAHLLLCPRSSKGYPRSRVDREKTRLTPSRRLSFVTIVRWLTRGWIRCFLFVSSSCNASSIFLTRFFLTMA